MIEMLIFISVVYILAIVIDKMVVNVKYAVDRNGFEIENLTNDEIFNLLKENMEYPGKKAVEIGKNGNVIVYGKYGSYEIVNHNSKIFVKKISKNILVDEVNYSLEREVIKNYIIKVLNTTINTDGYNFYKNAKIRIFLHRFVIIAVIVFIVGIVQMNNPSALKFTPSDKALSISISLQPLISAEYKKKDPSIEVSHVTLIHKGGKEYTGYVLFTSNGGQYQADLDVVSDNGELLYKCGDATYIGEATAAEMYNSNTGMEPVAVEATTEAAAQ